MENNVNKQPGINERSAVSEENMKKVTGGYNGPELWTDGRYHVRCDRCGGWIFGSSKADCLKRLDIHGSGECTSLAIVL